MPTSWRRSLLLVGATALLLGGGAPSLVLAADGAGSTDGLAWAGASALAAPGCSHSWLSGRGGRGVLGACCVRQGSPRSSTGASASRCRATGRSSTSRPIRPDVCGSTSRRSTSESPARSRTAPRTSSGVRRPSSFVPPPPRRLAATTPGRRRWAVSRLAPAPTPVGRSKQVWCASPNVEADAAWGADEAAVDAVLASATPGPQTTSASVTSSRSLGNDARSPLASSTPSSTTTATGAPRRLPSPPRAAPRPSPAWASTPAQRPRCRRCSPGSRPRPTARRGSSSGARCAPAPTATSARRG